MSVATALVRAKRGPLVSLATFGVSLVIAGALHAQGVTTGAVRGRVTDQQGAPIGGSSLQLVNRSSGLRFFGTTNAQGAYFVPNVIVGPYRIEARAIGYRPSARNDLVVVLGQSAEADFQLEAAAIEVEAISVTGEEDPLLSSSRTGSTSFVSERLIDNLPSLNRNFIDFIQTAPQVVGTSVAGQNNRFNNIQIDGGVNNDLFGLAASGTPGGQANARPISVEAVREFQVLIAPFDVRQGGFTGGLINAVTRSGTNRLSGSLFAYHQNESFVGKDSAGNKAAEFSQTQYGLTAGGPIIRDRLHFFTSFDLSRRNTPFAGQAIGSDPTGGLDSVNVGITGATAEAVRQIAINQYGFDPGGFRSPVIKNPDTNIFLKLTGQAGARGQFELSFNRVSASDYNLIRNSTATGFRDGYQLSESGYNFESVTNTLRGRLNTPFGRGLTNELLVAYQTVRDERALPNRRPLIFVGGERAGTNVAIGADRFSHANQLDQDIIEITDNLTIDMGRHTVTVGTHNEFFSFFNVFFPGSLGIWSFADTAAFRAGTPTRYEIALPGAQRPDGPVADFSVAQLGAYVQDQFRPNSRLTLTFGLRLDLPSLPDPVYNGNMDTLNATAGPRAGQPFGIRTDQAPTSSVLWSPRIGFNYDVAGDGSMAVRGGIGIFSGRPPYVWVSNAYANTGLEQASLVCTGANVPVFTADVANQPTTCGAGAVAPVPSIVFYEEGFRFPQTFRLALGLDRRLPWGMAAAVDFLYTRTLNSYFLNDVNLIEGGTSLGEGGRRLYGTMSGTGSSPRRQFSGARDVIGNFNENQDYQWSLTGELNKRFSDGLEFKAGYSYSQTRDLISMTSSITSSNLRFATLDGLLDDRNLARSAFDRPHKLSVSVSADIPYGFRGSLIYTGQSGSPYAYTVSNDANGDGLGGNDLVYVPLHSSDILLSNPAQFSQLESYIQSEPCLREQRGRVMERNSCRNPWQSFVNARVAKTFTTIRLQQIELTADVFNLLALLGVGGKIKETSFFEGNSLLFRTGYSAATGRGIYSLNTLQRERVNVNASRWRLMLGATYRF